MAGRKNTNKEKIEKAKKELETLSAILGEILDDAMTQTEAARKLGITPQEFRHETIGNFTNYVKKKNILTEDDILTYLKDMETPLDRIAKDMFNITDKNKLLIILKISQISQMNGSLLSMTCISHLFMIT